MIPDHELIVKDVTEKSVGMTVYPTTCRIQVYHRPTGLTAEAEARTQHRGREICMTMIAAALTDPALSRHIAVGANEGPENNA